MPVVKLSHIVSFSSEDKDHRADNLLKGNGGKWKCEVGGETNASVVIQLEKAVQISSIDVGNDGSAFVEVLVNRSAANDQNFQVLLSAQGLMNPTESRETTSTGRVKIFGKQKLSEKISQRKWDLVKFVCTQPFNKRVKYGLSFVTIHSKEEVKEEVSNSHSNVVIEEKKPAAKFGGFKLLADIKTEDTNPAKYRQYLLDEAAKHGVEITIIDKMSVKTKSDADDILQEKLRKKNKMTNKKNNGNGNSTKVDQDSDKSTPSNQKRKMSATPSSGDIDLPPLKRKVVRQRDPPVPKPSTSSSSSKPSTPQQVTTKTSSTKTSSTKTPSTSKDTSSANKTVAKLPDTMLAKKVEDKVKDKQKHEKQQKDKVKHKPKVAYEDILKDVVFVLSGFVHPERFDLRELATSMGATYAREWDHSCTHLICAFRNTPKYKQVLSSDNGGFIVKDNWLYACDKEKRKVSTRRYKWKNDSDDESDDDDVIVLPTTPPPQKTPSSSMTSQSKPSTSSTPNTAMTSPHTNGNNNGDDVTPALSDDDEENVRLFRGGRTRIDTTTSEEKCDDVIDVDDDIYDAETEVEDNLDDDDVMIVEDVPPPPFPELPDFLRKINFYIYGDFDDNVDRLLRRIIIACGGRLSNYMSNKVTHVITNSKSWSPMFDDAVANNPNLMFISFTWMYECGLEQKLIDHTPYLITKN